MSGAVGPVLGSSPRKWFSSSRYEVAKGASGIQPAQPGREPLAGDGELAGLQELTGQGKAGEVNLLRTHAVGFEPGARAERGHEVLDLAARRLGRGPDAVDVRVGDHAVDRLVAGGIGDDGRGVEGGEQRRLLGLERVDEAAPHPDVHEVL